MAEENIVDTMKKLNIHLQTQRRRKRGKQLVTAACGENGAAAKVSKAAKAAGESVSYPASIDLSVEESQYSAIEEMTSSVMRKSISKRIWRNLAAKTRNPARAGVKRKKA